MFESPSVSLFALAEYSYKARGGTYPIGEFAGHPHAITVLGGGDKRKAVSYLKRYQIMSELLNPSPNTASTWQTAKKEGLIRMLCLGGIGNPGKAVYPRNTATEWWNTIAIEKHFDLSTVLLRK